MTCSDTSVERGENGVAAMKSVQRVPAILLANMSRGTDKPRHQGISVGILSLLSSLAFVMAAIAQEAPDPYQEIAPSIRVEAFGEYLEGFPMIVAIDVYNPTDRATYYRLPEFDIFSDVAPVGFQLTRSEDGIKIDLPADAGEGGEGPPKGFTLEPGEASRRLLDLTNLGPDIEEGSYELRAEYALRKGQPRSEPISVRVRAPSPEDAVIAERLRILNDRRELSWSSFVLENWRTVYLQPPVPAEEIAELRAVDATGLSDDGRRLLAYYLFLHRATYGPQSVAELSLTRVNELAGGPLEAEALVLRYEILSARQDSAAADVRVAVLDRYPGVTWRLEQIERGRGRLSQLRSLYGAEREFTLEPDFYPYTQR